jgi:hypothetical protein
MLEAAIRSILLTLLVALAGPAPASAQGISEQEAQEIAREAYIYAYPMVLMDVTRQQLSNYAEPSANIPGAGPPNQFIHIRQFPDPKLKIVIRPNVDTLYSPAWLDLKAEPVVLSVPATDRYFMLPMLSMWTDVFAVPGTRTTGANSARLFLVTGPGWSGTVPAGMEVIKSPTRYVWFIGRTQTNGRADYANVHKIQDGYKLTPLSGWGKADYAPPKRTVDPAVDMTTPPPEQVESMDATAFFARFAELLKDNPPNQVDYPTINRLERAGFKAGQGFDLNAAPASVKQAFERGYADGRALLVEETKKASGTGWTYRTDGGAYGVNYPFRATIAKWGLGYNLPQDAVYPSLATDSQGRLLDGRNAYVLRFENGKLPPVGAFWSVTAYDPQGYFIPNTLERQAIGDRDRLSFNSDGSLDLFIQAESPGKDREANWLPVAKAPFNLLMRLYSPKDAILDRTWTPPPVQLREAVGGRALQ